MALITLVFLISAISSVLSIILSIYTLVLSGSLIRKLKKGA